MVGQIGVIPSDRRGVVNNDDDGVWNGEPMQNRRRLLSSYGVAADNV